jgi:hypothetical protein
MAEFLPAWVVVGAECLLTWGIRDEHVEKMTVTKITPTSQVVLNGNSKGERRFMLRDFNADGHAHKWPSAGATFSTGSLDLYPMDHEKVPRILAQWERNRAWGRVRAAIDRLERTKTVADGAVLVDTLSVWRRAEDNLSALS